MMLLLIIFLYLINVFQFSNRFFQFIILKIILNQAIIHQFNLLINHIILVFILNEDLHLNHNIYQYILLLILNHLLYFLLYLKYNNNIYYMQTIILIKNKIILPYYKFNFVLTFYCFFSSSFYFSIISNLVIFAASAITANASEYLSLENRIFALYNKPIFLTVTSVFYYYFFQQ